MTEWILSSSALILAVCLGRFLLKGRISLRLQYALWTLVLLRLLMPVNLFESAMSVQNLAWEEQVQQIAGERVAQIDVQDCDSAYASVVADYESRGMNVATVRPAVIERETRERMVEDITLGQVLCGIWLWGMAFMGAVLLISNWSFARKLRRSRRRIDGVRSPVDVYVTGAVGTPCLYGLFRPAIYLTREAADERILGHVLIHEITHYQHFDHVWAALRAVCLVLHWYNPLVWLAASLSRQDGELACDERVLARIGREHGAEYGRTLIELTCEAGRSSLLVAATTMTGGKRALRERIVLLMKQPRTALITAVALALCASLIVGCTFTGGVEETKRPEGSETTPIEPTGLVESIPVETEPVDLLEQTAGLFLTEDLVPTWYLKALTSYYDSPEQMDLSMLFYGGVSNEEITDEEEDFLVRQMGDWVRSMDKQRVTSAEMDEVLQTYFGITLDQADVSTMLDQFCYYEPTDAYLSAHTDSNVFPIEILQVVTVSDSGVQVHYCDRNHPDRQGIVTFDVSGDVWQIYSNRPLATAS